MSYLEEMFSLAGKTAVVAGGAGAIGTVMSDALLRAGANVVVLSRTKDSVSAFLARYRDEPELGKRAHGIAIDCGDEKELETAFDQASERFSAPEILVNGVGGNRGKTRFVDIDIATFRDILDLNLTAGLVLPTKVFCRRWIAENIKGSIINLTSMASYNPLSGVWAYDAAKAATLNLTMAAAGEFAAFGIRVNAIAPGFFLGKQNKSLLIDDKTGNSTERGKAVLNHTPFGRFGEVAELAGATVFLASSMASGFVTGVSIPVDGGYLIHNI
ncbi:MAG: short-chain dehydrogenase [Desulfobulbaceae bacterium BRH_c16a]|nr:MAG: short-chain dehydrogenase [Desulfobulbaceae bacterium BRH_c16a]